MKKASSAALIGLVAVVVWFAINRLWVVPIERPCNTFVSEFAPRQTPSLESKGDEWELSVSFTPANDDEATRIYFATFLGERTFEVSTTGLHFRASGRDGLLKIKVASKEESRHVLTDLCFK